MYKITWSGDLMIGVCGRPPPPKKQTVFFPRYEQCGLKNKILTIYSFMYGYLQHSEILRHVHTQHLRFVWTSGKKTIISLC